jgi:hypothetical protein
MLLRFGRNFSVLGATAIAAGALATLGFGTFIIASHRNGPAPLVESLRIPGLGSQDAGQPRAGDSGSANGDASRGAAAGQQRPPSSPHLHTHDLAANPSVNPASAGSASPSAPSGARGVVSLGKPAKRPAFVAPGETPREMTVRVGPPTPVLLRPTSPIAPVSVEMRVEPRPDVAPGMVRAGSIRADIARYNAEHARRPAPVRREPRYIPPPHDAWPYAH